MGPAGGDRRRWGGPEAAAVTGMQPRDSPPAHVAPGWASAGQKHGEGSVARQRSGEAAGVAWAGRDGGFAFSSPGREALQGRQPAPRAAPLRRERGGKELCSQRLVCERVSG